MLYSKRRQWRYKWKSIYILLDLIEKDMLFTKKIDIFKTSYNT